jgi:hypothetical protein
MVKKLRRCFSGESMTAQAISPAMRIVFNNTSGRSDPNYIPSLGCVMLNQFPQPSVMIASIP